MNRHDPGCIVGRAGANSKLHNERTHPIFNTPRKRRWMHRAGTFTRNFSNSKCETEIQSLVFSVATSFRGIGAARYTSLFQIRTAAEAFSALFREWLWYRHLGK